MSQGAGSVKTTWPLPFPGGKMEVGDYVVLTYAMLAMVDAWAFITGIWVVQ